MNRAAPSAPRPARGPDSRPDLSVAAAAAVLGCSAQTIRREIARGSLPATKVGRAFRIPAQAIADYQHRRNTRPSLRLITALPTHPQWRPAPALAIEPLPAPLTPFFGREAEIAAVTAELSKPEVRLLTLIGMGGVGKTRLALQIAALATATFPDGIVFVRLEAVTMAERIESAILRALGVREQGETAPLAQIARVLGGRRCLLVLDNLEHLPAAAGTLADLLSACATVTILATSRTLLKMTGEHVYRVGPLPVPAPPPATLGSTPPAPGAAIALFLDRARAARSELATTPALVQTAGDICRRLDGLPLAIELAAARCTALPPADLLARLDSRLSLLDNGPRDQPARLQTMRDAIAWSDALLPPDARRLFHRLAVFAGDFSFAAAAAMLEPPAMTAPDLIALPLVDLLLSHSLVAPSGTSGTSPTGASEPRFTMLETLREYGLAQLAATGMVEDTRDRHAAFFAAAVTAAPATTGAAWLGWLEQEWPNLRAALEWRISQGDTFAADHLAAALAPFWLAGGRRREGREWLARVLALPGPATPDRVLIQVTLAELLLRMGHGTEATPHATAAAGAAAALALIPLQARALLAAGAAHQQHGRLAAAGAAYDEALALARATGDARMTARALDHACSLAWAAGDHDRFAALAAEALALWRTLNDAHGLIAALDQMSLAARVLGDLARQAALAAEIMALAKTLSDPYTIAATLWTAAAISTERGQSTFAARMFGAEAAVREASGFVLDPTYLSEYEAGVGALRAILGEPRFTALWLAGSALERGAALDEAEAAMQVLATARQAGPGELAALVTLGLTARECEVLRLLVDGASDKEIAATLYVARSTASKHVSAILDKLGATSRTAATAIAYRHGLV